MAACQPLQECNSHKVNKGVKDMLENFSVSMGEVDNAVGIMREVAGWCEETGKNMWKLDSLTKDKLMEGLTEDNFYVGRLGDSLASSMILQWYDPVFWPEVRQDESGFIHKLCVRREFSGKGISRAMVQFAVDECKRKGIRWLRLDTGWNKPKLHALYESMGFVKVGRKTTVERDYALYEMKIDSQD